MVLILVFGLPDLFYSTPIIFIIIIIIIIIDVVTSCQLNFNFLDVSEWL